MRKLAIVAVLAMLCLVVAPALGAGNHGENCPYEEQSPERVGQPEAPVGNPEANSPGPAPNSGDGIPDGPGW